MEKRRTPQRNPEKTIIEKLENLRKVWEKSYENLEMC